MKIELKRNFGYTLVYTDDNVKIEEDVEERTFFKNKVGGVIWTNPQRDIKDETLNQYNEIMTELIHFRDKKYDGSALIEELFDKLPADIASVLVDKLYNAYLD